MVPHIGTEAKKAHVGSFMSQRPKAGNLSKLGIHLNVLVEAANQRGVAAKVALEKPVPQEAIDLAIKRLGEDNVIIF